MPRPTDKLRWLFLGGALCLAAVVAAFFGLANYRAGKVWQRILARNGVNLQQESNGITFSKSERGRTVFALHAAKSVPHGKGLYTLHDAVLILYGRDGRDDRISGNQFEYDQNQGVLRAVGEAHLDLQAPQSKTAGHRPGEPLQFAAEDEAAQDPALIHVRTSGLVYTRKTGLAVTDQQTEFRFRGMGCTSRGAVFDSEHNALHLLADVQMAGTYRRAPFRMVAAEALLDRSANTVDVREPRMTSGQRAGRAEHVRLQLRKDSSLDAADAEGEVQLTSGTQTLEAPRAHVDFGAENTVRHAQLLEGVRFVDTDAERPVTGSALSMDLNLAAGELRSVAAHGGTQWLLHAVPGRGTGARTAEAREMLATFVPEAGAKKRVLLQQLHMTGAARLTTDAPEGGAGSHPVRTLVTADDMMTSFDAADSMKRTPRVRALQGSGHTELQQTAADGAQQVSSGDHLSVSFVQQPGSSEKDVTAVSVATQTGHVRVHSQPASQGNGAAAQTAQPVDGAGDQALYIASQGTLTLSRGGGAMAELTTATDALRAPQIVLHQGTGDAEASGGVETTEQGQEAGAAAAHVRADHAALLRGAQTSEFFGTDAHPAQLWQAGSEVQAARLTLNGAQHRLSARPEGTNGVVFATFSSGPEAGRPGRARVGSGADAGQPGRAGQPQRPGALRASSSALAGDRGAFEMRAAAMDYDDTDREATFAGHVQLTAADGVVEGTHGAAFLAKPGGPAAKASALSGPPDLSGRLERLVIAGDVRLQQPGRVGTGNQLTYSAASNNYVLTGTPGHPPRVHDEQQGWLTGETLVFGATQGSIVVAGTTEAGTSKATTKGQTTRVHMETDIEQH